MGGCECKPLEFVKCHQHQSSVSFKNCKMTHRIWDSAIELFESIFCWWGWAVEKIKSWQWRAGFGHKVNEHVLALNCQMPETWNHIFLQKMSWRDSAQPWVSREFFTPQSVRNTSNAKPWWTVRIVFMFSCWGAGEQEEESKAGWGLSVPWSLRPRNRAVSAACGHGRCELLAILRLTPKRFASSLSGVIRANGFARFARIGWLARIGNSNDSGDSAWCAIYKNRGFNCEWFARIASRIARATKLAASDPRSQKPCDFCSRMVAKPLAATVVTAMLRCDFLCR